MADRTCSIDGCERKHYGRGMCSGHYQQWWKGQEAKPLKSDSELCFWSKVNKDGPVSRLGTKCWNWTGRPVKGYGKFRYGGRKVSAHRLAYALTNGCEPPDQIDHICHNRACVNPEHLRPVTNKQNQENQGGLSAANTSGVRGVSWDKRAQRWRARVTHNRKLINLGYFTNLGDAEQAAIAGRLHYFTHNEVDKQSA